MASEDTGGANFRANEFKEPVSTLDLNTERNVIFGNGSIKGTETRIRSRLIMDSDDDMDGDDDDDDDELLVMPGSSQKMGLQIDLSYSAPLSSKNDNSILHNQETENLDASSHSGPQSINLSLQDSIQSTKPTCDEESLFGEDFMAQFGDDGEIDSEAFLNKKPLFPRKVTLLEATIDDENSSGNNEDLGLDRLSISQKHWTKSGAHTVGEIAKSTHTATSSTTIISAVPNRFNMFNRHSMGSVPPMSQESSQLEEELLEMTARQHDASLEDLVLDDDLLGDEGDDDLGDILQMQYHAQELQELEQRGENETNKRKLPVSHTNHSTVASTSAPSIGSLPALMTSTTSSAGRIHEKTKKTRLEYASTGSLNPRDNSNGPSSSLQNFSIKSRLAEVLPKHDYTLPPETGSFIKARSSAGQTFYLKKRVHVDDRMNSFLQKLKESSTDAKPLLSMPIHRMMDELDAEIKIQKQEAINLLELGESDDIIIETDGANSQHKGLWVDKYKPRKYTDLMGDERVNRGVLSWIKEWDQCVFGRKYKKYVSEYKQRQQQQQQQQFKEFRKQDPLGRPDKKVLLITGPPGLGKTTMAHVIAKQAGYNVIEVNASDDRTGQSVKGKIESVLDNQSIIGNNKPSLLIIDEIDGVSSSGGEHSFIKLLVDIATVEAATKEDKAKAAAGKKSRKGTKKPLMRPIICICNDQYAPALRPLRVIAQIYQFKKPSIRSIVTRLQQICEIEQIPSDTRAFGALYEMTEGDMRSCLNTLQFIKGKMSSSRLSAFDSAPTRADGGGARGHGLTIEALSKASVGHKDLNKSLFSVWEELFQAPYARKSRGTLKVLEEGRDSLVKDDNKTYVSRMVTLIQTNGDYDKLMQGCFENYPTMIFHDVALSKVVDCMDWLSFYDQLNFKVSSNFEYEVGGYMAYALVNFHRFFAGSVRQKIEYPRKDYESYVAQKANEGILQSLALNLPAKIQRHFRKSIFATELLSPFLRILSPYLRPVNKQLIKPDERLVLQRLVEIMIHFQLTFVQEKTEDGQFIYRLEPSIEKLGDFSGIGLKNILPNRYAVRQLISQEIEVELVRRAEAAKAVNDQPTGKSKDSKVMSNSLGASLDSTLSMAPEQNDFEREAVDFFGRVIQPANPDEGSLDMSVSGGSFEQQVKKKKTRIWYKFNEGFTNAVKAKVFISELL